MKFKKYHLIGIILGIGVVAFSYFFLSSGALFFSFGLGIILAVLPFVISAIKETQDEREKEQMFLEFARNLAESVKIGTPISKSILNVKDKYYGVLSPHIKKLANQIYLGIPLVTAMQIFARDVGSKTVSRAVTLIGQAEKSGGDIGEILDSVASAVNTSDKLKKERRSIISTLVVQGYIIFFVFIIIVLILQFRIIPMIAGIGNLSFNGQIGLNPTQISSTNAGLDVSNAFLYLLLIQGFFSGLTIGKLSEKNLKAGIKHSFILMILSFLISSGANIFFGG